MTDTRSPDAIAQTIRPELDALERERQKVLRQAGSALRKLAVTLPIAGAIVLIAALASQGGIPAPVFPIALGVVALVTLAFHFGLKQSKLKAFAAHYKQRVVGRIVEELYPDVHYDADAGAPKDVFKASRLHGHSPDMYSAEDGFRGRVGDTDVLLSEVHAQYRQTTTDSNGRTTTRYITYFRGIFLVADFHKAFRCTVRILPDQAEKLFGRFGKMLQGFQPFSSEKLVYLEDPEFEKSFVVYGSDDVETRYLLSTSMARRILDLKERWNSDVRLSLHGSNIHVAIPFKKNLFEPDVKRPVDDASRIHTLVEEVRSCLGIVDDLNLNTRIWSKE